MYDIIIVGSGPAGITASIYAKRSNKKTPRRNRFLCGVLFFIRKMLIRT